MATAFVEQQQRIHIIHPEGPFKNEPILDYTSGSGAQNVREMREALRRVKGELGREYDLIIGGELVKTTDKIKSRNPARPSEVVGVHQKAGKEHVEPAMQAALRAFDGWRNTPVE